MAKLFEQPEKPGASHGYHFLFDLNNILVIRSYTPLLYELIDTIKDEFPNCNIDILQVKGSKPLPEEKKTQINEVFETYSAGGFLLRYIHQHYRSFEKKNYDAVFILYGVPRGLSRYFNVELYSYAVQSRYKIGYDIEQRFSVINKRELIFRSIKFIFSQIMFGINIFFTIVLIIYIMLVSLILSPLMFLHKSMSRK